MRSEDPNLKPDEWRQKVIPRYEDRNNGWTSAPLPSPANRELVFTRRPRRRRRDLKALLVIVVALFLCSAVTALGVNLWRKSHPSTAAPVVAGQGGVPTPSAAQALPNGQTKILLLGTDRRPNDAGYRTDVVLLLVLDPDKQTVTAVSFPRDLWVKLPKDQLKINQVMGIGGFDLEAQMFLDNFGVKPDYYVMTNFNGFVDFINNRGGIDVEVGQELTDRCDIQQNVGGSCTVTPGTVHMDGAMALWYVRSRHTTSDLDRLRREQEVIFALVRKMVSFQSIATLGQMKDEVGSNVETNISIPQAVSWIPFAISMLNAPDHIQRIAVGTDQATEMLSWNGEWVLVPVEGAIQEMLKQAGIKL
jgi:LCP family protein required for cell wall assembly